MKKKVALVLAGAFALSTLPYDVFAASTNRVSNLFISTKDVSYISSNATSSSGSAITYADLVSNENNDDLVDYYKSISGRLGVTGTQETIYTNFYDVLTGGQWIINNDGTGILTPGYDSVTSELPAPKFVIEMDTDLLAGEQFEVTLTNATWSVDEDLYLPNTDQFAVGLDAERKSDTTIRFTARTTIPEDTAIRIPLIATLEGNESITITVNAGNSAVTGGTYALTNQIEGNVTLSGDNGVLTISEEMPGTVNPNENLYIQIRGSKAEWVDGAVVEFEDNRDFGITSATTVILETDEENIQGLEENLTAGSGEYFGRTLVMDIPGNINKSGFKADYEIDLSKALKITDRDFAGQIEVVVWGAGIDSSDKERVEIYDLEGDVEVTVELDDDGNVEDLISGRQEETASTFEITEKVEGSLRDDRYIKFQLNGGATWDPNGTTVSISDASVSGDFNLIPDLNDDSILYLDKDTVTFDTDTLNTITINPIINLEAKTEGDVTVTISGPGISGGEKTETIATTVAPISIDAEVSNIKAGFTNIPTNDIVINENFAGALTSGEYRIFADLDNIEGLKVASVSEDTVTDGELEAEISLDDDKNILVDITSESTETPSKLTISGIEIYADSTVPTSKEPFTLTFEGYDNTEDLVNGYEFDYVTTGNVIDEPLTGGTNLNANVGITLNDTAFTIDGEYTGELLAAPYISKTGSTMIPVRAISYALGIPEESIFWHQDSQTVTIEVSDTRVAQFKLGSDVCTINGVAYPIISSTGSTGQVEMKDNYTYLPLRFLGETVFNVKVDWDTTSQTAIFNVME